MKTSDNVPLWVAGHTLGTPHQRPADAVRLFHAAKLDGAEIIWQDDYRGGIPEHDNGAVLADIRQACAETGLDVIGLTPYMTDLNSLDPADRDRDLERFSRCLADAEQLGAGLVRVYAGSYTPDQVDERASRWARLVESLTELAPIAAGHGVVLVVENHFNTMTMTAAESQALVNDVSHPNVAILYDQANLTFTHGEDYHDAVRIQGGSIAHVHVKDLIFVDRERPFSASSVATVSGEERAVRSRVVGDGELDWTAIMRDLLNTGYRGAVSLEYEYRWHPHDLPEPLEGFTRGAERIRAAMTEALTQ
ncbi:MAG: sugar phosphate isomerase/epimerase family protein [Nostocoides sp.]